MSHTEPTFRPRHMILRFDPAPGERSPWVTAARHEFKNGVFSLTVPTNFRTDLASVPGWLLWLFGPNDRHQRAALFHDAAYCYKPCQRSTADEIFRVIMLYDGVHPLRAWLMWAAVRLFGSRAWTPKPPRGFTALALSVANRTTAAVALLLALALAPSSSLLATPPPPLGLTTPCRIVDVIDGDTIEVEITRRLRVRLLDCWAPETRTTDAEEKRRGLAAKTHMIRLTHGATEEHVATLHIPTAHSRTLGDLTTLGRAIGSVWLPGATRSLSEQQVAAGHAKSTK